MRFFTKKWHAGNMEDREMNETLNKYNEYITQIYAQLPVTLKILAKSISLHDGFIKNVLFFENQRKIIISGIFGDLEFGYYTLKLKYMDIQLKNLKLMKDIFSNKKLEILFNEIEVLHSNIYSHKFLFSSEKEIEIIFQNLELEIINDIPDNYKISKCLFNVINE